MRTEQRRDSCEHGVDAPVADSSYVIGEALDVLRTLPANFAQTAVTSPPYWGLRDYQHPRQLGLEEDLQDYVERLAGILDEVRRVLKPDGTLWLNLGDSYIGPRCGGQGPAGQLAGRAVSKARANVTPTKRSRGLKRKDLAGVPWRVAFALQDRGWWLRSDIIWRKPDPIPESVKDRPTRSHEYLFLLSKSRRYYYDERAIRERDTGERGRKSFQGRQGGAAFQPRTGGKGSEAWTSEGTRNKRDVWTVAGQPYSGAHFAVFPPKLIEPCILAGSRLGDVVLDPFLGSGTTGMVAQDLGRRWFGIELDPRCEELILDRTKQQGFSKAFA